MDLDSSFLTFSPKPKNKSFASKKLTKMSLKHQDNFSPQRTNILQDSVNSLKYDAYEYNKFSTKISLNMDKASRKEVNTSSEKFSKRRKNKFVIDKENYEMKNKIWSNAHIKKSLPNNAVVLDKSLNHNSEIFNGNCASDINEKVKRVLYRDSCPNSNNSSYSDIVSGSSPSLELLSNGSSPDVVLVSDSSPSPPKVRVNKTVIVESESECEQTDSTPPKKLGVCNSRRKIVLETEMKGVNKTVIVESESEQTDSTPPKKLGVCNSRRKFVLETEMKGVNLHCNTTPEFVSQTEDILNKLYGNDWDKEKVLPKSAPHLDSFRRNDHNQSSSSEDNFDEFIRKRKELTESIRRKALTPLNTDENFITDDSLEDSSIVFYHSVLQKLEEKRRNFLVSIQPKKLSFGSEQSDSSSDSSDTSVSSHKPRYKSPKSYSFLESLSSNIPLAQAHPEAQTYRVNFKKTKEELTKVLFKLFNTEVFENQLPADLNIMWNARMYKTAGTCHNRGSPTTGRRRVSRIELSIKVCSSAERLRDTMIHEMCHAAVWIINQTRDGHGPYWRHWASRAMKRFPELPIIERCHNYEIETKYTFKCENCGYSIGRQSKSINLVTQRCGYCVGRFVLLVNKRKKTSNGQPEKQLTTPRAPSAFALFVKENYSAVKQSKSNLKHAEVMKYLGQKFTALKVSATDNS